MAKVKKSEIALSVLIIMCSLYGQSSIFDLVIDFMWIVMLFCALKNTRLFYGLIAGVSLFSSQLFVPVISLLTINAFAVVISIYFVYKKIKEEKKLKVNSQLAWFFVIIVLYIILVLGAFIGKTTQIIMVFATLLLCCELVTKLKKEENLKIFANYFVLATMSASVYGLIRNTSFVDVADRFCGTNSDPNYFGYFLIISFVFLNIIKNDIPRLLYYLGKIALIILVILTGSNTALIALLLVLAFGVLFKRVSIIYKVFFVLLLLIIGGLVMWCRYDIGKFLLNVDVDNYYLKRYFTTFGNLIIGEANAATSGRADIVGAYLSSFNDFSIIEKLFGGHVCGAFGVDSNYAGDASRHLPHNLNIDVLFSIGIFGLVYVYSIVFSSIVYWFRQRSNEVGKNMLLLKAVVVLYTFSLSYFLGFPSMIFLFL